ncbi:hypothetical protein QFZ67_000206 [Streptomyces sp. V1I1]|nr:hypothetical protein [Streptomyces sp. V1I1]
MQHTKSSAETSGTAAEEYNGFTAEERAAMKEHAQEQKQAAARRGSRAEKEAAAERDVLAKIAEMPEADRVLAERIHAIVKAAHFQSAQKFKSRYATLGFSDQAGSTTAPALRLVGMRGGCSRPCTR